MTNATIIANATAAITRWNDYLAANPRICREWVQTQHIAQLEAIIRNHTYAPSTDAEKREESEMGRKLRAGYAREERSHR